MKMKGFSGKNRLPVFNCACNKVPIIVLSTCYTQDKLRKEREYSTMDYSIVWVRGHVEVYDHTGRFCFSADNEREARQELEEVA